MSRKNNFLYSLYQTLKHNKDGAFETQDERRKALRQTVNTLWAMGYKLDHVKYIRQRHIYKLVDHWKNKQGNGVGTLKNKLTHLRWLMGKFNKSQVVPSNTELNLGKRQYVTNKDKSRALQDSEVNSIKHPYYKMSLRAQALFGLRVSESLKIKPYIADKGDQLYLKGSWTKGGKPRYIPITSQAQRDWIEAAKTLVKHKGNSLIPPNKSYKTHRGNFDKACQRAGINKCHGHRHLYAQNRFQELAGYPCPAKGGPLRSSMSKDARDFDTQVRLQISRLLGHERIQITAVYLGR